MNLSKSVSSDAMAKLILEVFDDDGQRRALYLSRPIDDGLQGNREALNIAAAMVRKAAPEPDTHTYFVRHVVPDVKGHDYDGEIEACFLFARDKIKYRRDPVGVERVSSWYSTLYRLNPKEPEGDCLIKTIFLCSGLASLGHRPFFIPIQQVSITDDSFNHIYCGLHYDGTHYKGQLLPVDHLGRPYLPLDPTPEDARAGWQTFAVRRVIYPIF